MDAVTWLIFRLLYLLVAGGMTFIVLLDNRSPVKTMAWILVFIFLPILGLILYFFFGRDTRKERLISKKGYSRLSKRPMSEYQAQEALSDFTGQSMLIPFFHRVNNALPFERNEVEFYTDGYSMLQSLIREISKAKHHVHLEFYIFQDDAVGRLLRDVLIDKAREGVNVRVLYDDVGCWKVNPIFFDEMLCEGIDVRSFLKVRFPQFTGKINYRNHRKLAIIDGRVGFIGGMNIALRYLKGVSWGKWRDTHACLKGKAVYGIQTAFLTDWFAVDCTLLTSAAYFPKMEMTGTSTVQVVTSDAIGEWHDMMLGLVKGISCAKRYLYLESPYFLPTEQVKAAIQTAALSGVDVRLMIPKKADTILIHKGTLSYLGDLMEAGVKVYMYRAGFLHSKLWVADDEWASVGSTNLDFRSFEHNFESNAFFYDKGTVCRLKEIFMTDLQDCFQLSLKQWQNRSLKEQFIESAVRLVSPLL